MLQVISFALALLAAGAPAPDKPSTIMQGRWKIDVDAAMQTLHASPEYASASAEGRAAIDKTFAVALPLLVIEITADTLTGADGTERFVVSSESGKTIVLHIEEPAPARDLTFEIVDGNTMRMREGSNDPLSFLLRRDLEYAARQARPRPTVQQQQKWLDSMRGVWSVDLAAAILEEMKKSPEWARATAEERAREESLLASLGLDSPADLVEFTRSEMRGVGKSNRQPMAYEITTIDGPSAYARVSEANGVSDEWHFERTSEDLVRVSSRGRLMFVLRRVKPPA